MKRLVETITEYLVDYKEDIIVDISEGSEVLVIEVSVNPKDIGKIIGRKGVTADSFRTILGCAGAKQGKKTVLQILDSKKK